MDKFQHKLRVLIATGSTIGFLGGWALLAHAGKPVSNTDVSVDTAPDAPVINSTNGTVTLPPLDFKSLENSGTSQSVQPFTVQPAPQSSFAQPSFRPRLRTRAS